MPKCWARPGWRNIAGSPSRRGTRSPKGEDSTASRRRLRGILDFFAERDGDVDARIALRTQALSSPWAYLELARFCLEHDRAEEALRHAEDGLRLFESKQPDEPLLIFTVDLLARRGRKDDALAHLWRAFEKDPGLELYAALRKHAGKAAIERATAIIEQRLEGKRASEWSHPADLLIGVLLKEKLFDAAWAAVNTHGASSEAKQDLARASEAKHPQEALAAYTQHVEKRVAGGGYEEAVKLVRRMAALRSDSEQAEYVAALRLRHMRKRNFMKLLG